MKEVIGNYLGRFDPAQRKNMFNNRIVFSRQNDESIIYINTVLIKTGYVGEHVELMEIRRFKIKFSDVFNFYRGGLSYFSPSVLIWKLFHYKFKKI